MKVDYKCRLSDWNKKQRQAVVVTMLLVMEATEINVVEFWYGAAYQVVTFRHGKGWGIRDHGIERNYKVAAVVINRMLNEADRAFRNGED